MTLQNGQIENLCTWLFATTHALCEGIGRIDIYGCSVFYWFLLCLKHYAPILVYIYVYVWMREQKKLRA